MMNLQEAIETVMRQGQRETEDVLIMQKRGYHKGPSPLIAAFKDDHEILRLEIDIDNTKQVMRDGFLYSPLCMVPSVLFMIK